MTPFLSFLIQVITPEVPCRVTWDRYRQQPPMSNELLDLLREVEQLRKETDALVCRCKKPNCPFHHTADSKSMTGSQTSLNSLTSSLSSEEDDRLILRRQWSPPTIGVSTCPLSKSTGNLTYVVPGVQRRADGTIVEGDGPRYSIGQERKMRRCGTYNGFTQTNYLDIANCVIRETEDCAVDYENTFTNEGYKFSRQAPERRQFRSPKIQKRHSKLKTSASYPIGTSSSNRKNSLPPSPSLSHKSTDSASEETNGQLRGRSDSSPVVPSSTRHMSLDQSTQKWSRDTFQRSTQQA